MVVLLTQVEFLFQQKLRYAMYEGNIQIMWELLTNTI